MLDKILNKKIEYIWVFTAIFVSTLSILIVAYQGAVAIDRETEINENFIVKQAKAQTETTLIFGGDVMLARTVEQKILAANDYSLPFQKIADEFKEADLTFINLESPFFDGGSATPNGSVVFRALSETIEGLKLAGIDIVSLANNHFGNQGVAGEKFTFEHLTNNEIEYCGAGNNFEQAHESKIIAVKGIKIGFFAYAYPESLYVATENSPGVANMEIDQMKKDLTQLNNSADIIIVSMHAGAEYTHNPGRFQINFAHTAIEAGADLVVGHHPHVVQTTEKYNDGYIIYSLGNLVFDQMWSEETQQGAVVKAIISENKLKSLEFKPVHIYDYNQPDWASQEESKEILSNMGLEEATVILSRKP
ncbi:MAG: CapA family protein [Patescibacteria group bacterium]|nr:CapA family protein [Patescibacteria group bacterium]